jgi:hypothetical protein
MNEKYDINWEIINKEDGWYWFITLIWFLFKLTWVLILLWISFCVVICTWWVGLIIVLPILYLIFRRK